MLRPSSRQVWLAAALLALVALAAQFAPGPAEPDQGLLPAPDLTPFPWLYLRGGRLPAANEPVVELIVVGDVMLGRGVADEAWPLAQVAPWLAAADLTLGNLESVLAFDRTSRRSGRDDLQPILLRAPVTAVAHLAQAGFDLLGLANNHSLDYGPAGLVETAWWLTQAGITPLGAGPGADAACRPVVRTVAGLRLAFLAFNAVAEPGPADEFAADPGDDLWQRCDWDRAQAIAAVAAARAQADALVVSLHWGYEYEPVADPSQVTMVEALFAAGADLVVGHHPHVVQNTVAAEGRFAAYGLGNLVFDQGQEETTRGLALRTLLDGQGLRAVQALPLRAGPRPRLMTPAEAQPLLARVAPPPQWLGITCRPDGCTLEAVNGETPAAGPFWSGWLDLTGDGVPERVRRVADQVTVYQEGDAVWQSPPEWQVVDLALGDPNDDGRGELLLALWRPDSEGYLRSQPYLVGYRGGEYKVLWGGRALVYPLREVEVGDVDEDGRPELVVIEEQGTAVTVAIWRWQGWSFSLVWRSPPGRYHSLALMPSDDGRASLRVARSY